LPASARFEIGFKFGYTSIPGCLGFFIGVERRRIAGRIQRVGTMEISCPEGDRGGIPDSDAELRWCW